MNIDILFRQIKEIQFKADKLLKLSVMNDDELRALSAICSQVKTDLKLMESNDVLSSFVDDLFLLDADYTPQLNLIEKILGAVSFGWWKKRCMRKKRMTYFSESIRTTKDQFSHIEYLLKAF